MKTARKFLVTLSVVTVISIFTCLVLVVLRQDDWKKRTTPLPGETVNILCTNLQLGENHSLCIGRNKVYGPDFYDILRDTFRPYEEYEIPSSEASTYEEVEKILGSFKYECDDVETTGDGFSFFSCRYDLRGDREFIIGIIYSYPDQAVFRINTPMGFDSE